MASSIFVMDRLKALGLDVELRNSGGARTAGGKFFFHAAGPSPAEQFYAFAYLCHRMALICGLQSEEPQDEDDPNYTASTILDTARSLEVAVDFPPNKLKQGFGEHVVYILDRLSEKAMAQASISWSAPRPELTGDVDNEVEGPGVGQDVDEEDLDALDEDPQEEMFYSDNSDEDNNYGNHTERDGENEVYGSSAPQLDEQAWRQEVERAVPLLRVRVMPSARDWRAHLTQLATHRQELGKISGSLWEGLKRSTGVAAEALQAAAARDSLLANSKDKEVERLAKLREETEIARDTYKTASVGVTKRQEILNDLTDKVEAVKQKTESKGSSMNDTSPVVNIRASIVSLRKEIQQMDLQLSVLMWFVLDHQIRAAAQGGKA